MCGCSQLDKCTPHSTQDNTYSTSQTNLHLDENPMSRSKGKKNIHLVYILYLGLEKGIKSEIGDILRAGA